MRVSVANHIRPWASRSALTIVTDSRPRAAKFIDLPSANTAKPRRAAIRFLGISVQDRNTTRNNSVLGAVQLADQLQSAQSRQFQICYDDIEALPLSQGQSFVAAPNGQVLRRASIEKEEVMVVPCDLEKVEFSRTHWPFLRDRRIDAYGDLTRRFVDAK